jgi:lipopolysaccharide transport system ATP-binding protein
LGLRGFKKLARDLLMSSDIAIKVEGLSKCYQIYDRPQDRLKQMLMRGRKQYYREFWALKDVSFEVRKGECFGVLGRNGAGKSTLLQILAGTLNPSAGNISTSGRVAALLELGSGFDPEFSGRENVYINAALLGLSPEEIDRKFDAIVAFSEVGEFLDQPVKTYSSGMLVRLAFATAIHVEPDILIVDEALAVGDFAFQHKCMTRIKKIIAEGVTVILVTHDVGAVMANCDRALMLRNGAIYTIGSAASTCDRYLEYSAAKAEDKSESLEPQKLCKVDSNQFDLATESIVKNLQPLPAINRWGTGQIQLTAWSLSNSLGKPTNTFHFGEKMRLSILLSARENISHCFPGFMLRDRNGYHLTGITTRTCGKEISNLSAGDAILLEFDIDLLYRADNYNILLNIANDEYGTGFYDLCENAGNFTILDANANKPPWGDGRTYLPTTLQVSMLKSGNLV